MQPAKPIDESEMIPFSEVGTEETVVVPPPVIKPVAPVVKIRNRTPLPMPTETIAESSLSAEDAGQDEPDNVTGISARGTFDAEDGSATDTGGITAESNTETNDDAVHGSADDMDNDNAVDMNDDTDDMDDDDADDMDDDDADETADEIADEAGLTEAEEDDFSQNAE